MAPDRRESLRRESDQDALVQSGSVTIPVRYLLPFFTFLVGSGGGTFAAGLAKGPTQEDMKALQVEFRELKIKVETINKQAAKIDSSVDLLKEDVTDLIIEVRTNSPQGVQK